MAFKREEYRTWDVGEQIKEKGMPNYLIDRVLQERTQAILYAPTGHGKSFIGIDQGLHLATGFDYNGMKVRKTPVVYVSAEAPEEADKRAVAWKNYYNTDVSDFKIIAIPLQLHDEQDMQYVKKVIKEIGAGLVIFDTAEKVSVGTDENLPTQVNMRVNAPLEDIKNETGATTLVIHHQGSGKHPRPRGCSAWSTPNDTMMRVETQFEDYRNRDLPTHVKLYVEKQRGDQPITLDFTPEVIPAPEGRTTLLMVPKSTTQRKRTQTQRKVAEPKKSSEQKLVELFEKKGKLINQEVANELFNGNLPAAKTALSRAKGKVVEGKVVVNTNNKWGIEYA